MKLSKSSRRERGKRKSKEKGSKGDKRTKREKDLSHYYDNQTKEKQGDGDVLEPQEGEETKKTSTASSSSSPLSEFVDSSAVHHSSGPTRATNRVLIQGHHVAFPTGKRPFPAQYALMGRIIQALKTGKNALLESPTGTGKTLALLCSTLSWQRREYEESKRAAFMEAEEENKLRRERSEKRRSKEKERRAAAAEATRKEKEENAREVEKIRAALIAKGIEVGDINTLQVLKEMWEVADNSGVTADEKAKFCMMRRVMWEKDARDQKKDKATEEEGGGGAKSSSSSDAAMDVTAEISSITSFACENMSRTSSSSNEMDSSSIVPETQPPRRVKFRRIFFASRTHSQINQVATEGRKEGREGGRQKQIILVLCMVFRVTNLFYCLLR